jgi:hypothetical protein
VSHACHERSFGGQRDKGWMNGGNRTIGMGEQAPRKDSRFIGIFADQ